MLKSIRRALGQRLLTDDEIATERNAQVAKREADAALRAGRVKEVIQAVCQHVDEFVQRAKTTGLETLTVPASRDASYCPSGWDIPIKEKERPYLTTNPLTIFISEDGLLFYKKRRGGGDRYFPLDEESAPEFIGELLDNNSNSVNVVLSDIRKAMNHRLLKLPA